MMIVSRVEHDVYGPCQGDDRRTVLAVWVLLRFGGRVWTRYAHPSHSAPDQVAVRWLTPCAPSFLCFALPLLGSLVKIWDTVKEDQSVAGEYRVLTGRM